MAVPVDGDLLRHEIFLDHAQQGLGCHEPRRSGNHHIDDFRGNCSFEQPQHGLEIRATSGRNHTCRYVMAGALRNA